MRKRMTALLLGATFLLTGLASATTAEAKGKTPCPSAKGYHHKYYKHHKKGWHPRAAWRYGHKRCIAPSHRWHRRWTKKRWHKKRWHKAKKIKKLWRKAKMWRKAKKMKLYLAAKCQARFYKTLSPKQVHALKKLKLEKKLALMPLKARIRLHKAELKAQLLAFSPDDKKIEAALQAWGKAKEAKYATKLDFFLKARKVLTTDEQKKHHMRLWLKKKKAWMVMKFKIAAKYKMKKLAWAYKIKKYKKRHACPCLRWKKACHKGCKKSCKKYKKCKTHCSCPRCAHARYYKHHCKCPGCYYARKHYRYKKRTHHKKHKKFKMFHYYQMKRFWHSLSAEQKKLKWNLKYDKVRQILPLKAQCKLEKARLVSMMMDLNVSLDALKKQIHKMVQAKLAAKRVKIKTLLAFRKSLDDKQKWQHAYLKLRCWKKQKKVAYKAKKYFKRALLLVRLKSYKFLKYWGLWKKFEGKPASKKAARKAKAGCPYAMMGAPCPKAKKKKCAAAKAAEKAKKADNAAKKETKPKPRDR